ncbi:MAG: tail fiber domain-containing protein [Candidatus Paceibacterota bacterium]
MIFRTQVGGTAREVIRILSGGNVGIGTTSPYAKLSVVGEVVAEKFTATSTTATSTFTNLLVSGNSSLGTVIGGTWQGSAIDISDYTNLSITAAGLELTDDAIALTSGYNIPLTASTTNWNNFYDTPSSRITAGTGLSWSSNTLNASSVSLAWATTTSQVAGQIVIHPVNNTDILLVGGTSTSTAKFILDPNANKFTVGTGGSSADSTLELGDDTAYWNIGQRFADNSFGIASSTSLGTGNYLTILGGGNVGIGTSSPYAKLSIAGETVASHFTATSTTATSTLTNLHITNAFRLGSDYLTDITGTGLTITNNALTVNGLINAGLANMLAGFDASGNLTSTSTPQVAAINATSTTATSTFAGGLTAGGSNGLTVLQNGNVGVGTTSPAEKLHVVGNAQVDGNVVIHAIEGKLKIGYSTWPGDGVGYGWWMRTTDDGDGATRLHIGDDWAQQGTGKSHLVINQAGNISIGTTTPYSKLTVWGGGTGTGNLFELVNNASTTVARFQDNGTGYFLGNIGIGTTSPYAKLSVVGETVSEFFTATSTTATSTLAGDVVFGSGGLTYHASQNLTSIDNVELGAINFDSDAGMVSWVDLPVSTTPAAGTIQSYTAQIDGNNLLTVYAEADGSGSIQNPAIGIGTTSPYARLSITGTAGQTRPLFQIASSTDNPYLTVTSDGKLGLGTTSPYTKLSVVGEVVAEKFTATSTTATSTFTNLLVSGNSSLGTVIGGTWQGSAIDISDYTNLSITAAGLELVDDAIALSDDYLIPSTASTTNWNSFYDTPSSRITAGTGLTWSGNTLNVTDVSSLVAWATTTSQVAGQILIHPVNDTDILLVGGTSTSTAKFILDPNANQFTVGTGGSSADSTLELGSDTSYWNIGKKFSDGSFGIASSTALGTGNFLTILADGNVGIATSSPSSALAISQSADTLAGGVWLAASDGDYRAIYMNTSQVLNFEGGAGNTATLNAAGEWTNASDIAYKENIEELNYGLSEIMLLQPRRYHIIGASASSTNLGFVAQELELVLPELVTGEDGAKGISYGNLVTVAIKAIQDLARALEELGVVFVDGVARFVNLFAERVTTDELCIGETCVTESQLQQLLQNAGSTPSSSGGQTAPTGDSGDTGTTTDDSSTGDTATTTDDGTTEDGSSADDDSTEPVGDTGTTTDDGTDDGSTDPTDDGGDTTNDPTADDGSTEPTGDTTDDSPPADDGTTGADSSADDGSADTESTAGDDSATVDGDSSAGDDGGGADNPPPADDGGADPAPPPAEDEAPPPEAPADEA